MSFMGNPSDPVGEVTGDTRDSSGIPGSGGSPGEGHGNPLRYSSLTYPMDRGAWRATVHESDMPERLGYKGLGMT